MLTYVKPSGVEVQIDKNSVSAAVALGWKPKTEKVVVKSKKAK